MNKTIKNIIIGLVIVIGIGICCSIIGRRTLEPQKENEAIGTSPAYVPPVSPSSHFTVKVNKFSTDEYGYFKVIGEITNIDIVPYKFVTLEAEFLNKAETVVGKEMTYACGTDYIMPGGKKSFEFMGSNQPDYNSVHVNVTGCRKVE